MKVLTTALLVALSLLVALLLETRLKATHPVEIVLILIGVCLSLVILFGLWIETDWAYPLAIIFFAASMANLLWLFTTTQTFLTFAFGILVNVAGMVICIVSIKGQPDWQQTLETYNASTASKKKRKR